MTRNFHMVNKAVLLLVLLHLLMSESYSQNNPFQLTNQGLYISSKGAIKALAVFIQFKDDTHNPGSEYWKPGEPPVFLNTYIDSSLDQVSEPWSFSDYFRNMSDDSLRIYGRGYFAVTKHPEEYYRNQAKRISGEDTIRYGNDAFSLATKEVLTALDSRINYAEYDNWSFQKNKHENHPDGIVDLIIVLYRTLTWPPNASGIAQLGSTSEIRDTILDGKTIGFGFAHGSGITNSGGSQGMAVTLRSMKHEFGHRLFGSGHPAYNGWTFQGSTTQYHGMWGIMPLMGFCANAAEREKMGWINPVRVTGNRIDTLTDFVTTGKTVKIPIRGTKGAYYLEYHNQQSIYDSELDQVNGKGLMIYSVKDTSAYHPLYDVETADGKFKWSNPYWVPHPFGGKGELPVFTKLEQHRNGYDMRDYIPHTRPDFTSGKFQVYIMDDDSNGGEPYYLFNGWNGNGNTGFRKENNRVFAPWTNPGSGNDKNISVSILEDTGEYIIIKTDVEDITLTEDALIPAEKFEFTGNLVVPEGITLTIENGAELKFAGGKRLVEYGKVIRMKEE